MQVEAAAALAPVLARFSIVVHGPLEAEVVGRIVAGGDLAVPLRELARPLTGDPSLSRPATVALVRTVLARLVAGGTVEHVGGGYRLVDPGVAATLRGVVESMVAATSRTAAPTPPPTAAPVPLPLAIAPEEASRLLQGGLTARPLPPTLPALSAPPGPSLPAAWATLVEQGWTLDATAPGSGPSLVAAGTASRTGLHVVVAEPHAPPAIAAGRLATLVPTRLTHLPVAPVRWGEGDPAAARALAPVLGEVLGAGARPVVLDRGLVPALSLLVQEVRSLPTVVVDLRSSIGRPVPTTEATTGLAGMLAGAAAVSAPHRRPTGVRGGRRGVPTLLEVLFGARFADEVGEDGEATASGAAPDVPSGAPAGVVVTARTDDPQAEALAELLGVEVVHLQAGDDLAPEVLAFLEDEDGQTLLAPSL